MLDFVLLVSDCLVSGGVVIWISLKPCVAFVEFFR